MTKGEVVIHTGKGTTTTNLAEGKKSVEEELGLVYNPEMLNIITERKETCLLHPDSTITSQITSDRVRGEGQVKVTICTPKNATPHIINIAAVYGKG